MEKRVEEVEDVGVGKKRSEKEEGSASYLYDWGR